MRGLDLGVWLVSLIATAAVSQWVLRSTRPGDRLPRPMFILGVGPVAYHSRWISILFPPLVLLVGGLITAAAFPLLGIVFSAAVALQSWLYARWQIPRGERPMRGEDYPGHLIDRFRSRS